MSAEACFKSDRSEWMTPDEMIRPTLEIFGGIDLDPCSNVGIPNVPADEHFTIDDDGLSRPWHGRVYCNQPYGRAVPKWTMKAIAEVEAGNVEAVILLVAARTDTDWFQPLFDYPICFRDGRFRFLEPPDGTPAKDDAPFPSAIVFIKREYSGDDLRQFCETFGHFGKITLGAL